MSKRPKSINEINNDSREVSTTSRTHYKEHPEDIPQFEESLAAAAKAIQDCDISDIANYTKSELKHEIKWLRVNKAMLDQLSFEQEEKQQLLIDNIKLLAEQVEVLHKIVDTQKQTIHEISEKLIDQCALLYNAKFTEDDKPT